MSHIELSFVTEASLGSQAIRWFTHSDFSHVDIITPGGYRLGGTAFGLTCRRQSAGFLRGFLLFQTVALALGSGLFGLGDALGFRCCIGDALGFGALRGQPFRLNAVDLDLR